MPRSREVHFAEIKKAADLLHIKGAPSHRSAARGGVPPASVSLGILGDYAGPKITFKVLYLGPKAVSRRDPGMKSPDSEHPVSLRSYLRLFAMPLKHGVPVYTDLSGIPVAVGLARLRVPLIRRKLITTLKSVQKRIVVQSKRLFG